MQAQSRDVIPSGFNGVVTSVDVAHNKPQEQPPLPTASCPLLKTLPHVPLTPLPTDNEISDIFNAAQLSADNKTLSAAISLSLLTQPVDGKSSQSHSSVV
jgi:hypothetical protein